MNKHEDKTINNMILFLRINNIAEFQYIESTSDYKFFDYQTRKKHTREEIIQLAKENQWHKDWGKNG